MSPKTELKCLLVRFKGQTTVFEQQALDINKLSRIKFIFWLFAFKTAKTDSSKQQQKHIKIHINSLLQHFSSVHLKYSEHSNMNKTFILAGKQLFRAEVDGGELYYAAGVFQKRSMDILAFLA